MPGFGYLIGDFGKLLRACHTAMLHQHHKCSDDAQLGSQKLEEHKSMRVGSGILLLEKQILARGQADLGRRERYAVIWRYSTGPPGQ
jgi:hypothetical protein